MQIQDAYLVRTVINHLKYLRDEWNQNIILENVIVNSKVLRILLVEGNLEKAWRLCGYTYPIRLKAITLTDILGKQERSKILTAVAGGAIHRGVRWALITVSLSDTEKQEKKKSSQNSPQAEELTLDQYLHITCMIIGETDIDRIELIKYVANKLGGAHLDFSRSNKPLEQKFTALDSLHKYQQVEKNIIPYELLSIGQELINSKHVHRLMKRNL